MPTVVACSSWLAAAQHSGCWLRRQGAPTDGVQAALAAPPAVASATAVAASAAAADAQPALTPSDMCALN